MNQKLILISAGHTNDPKNDRGAAGNGFIEGVEAVVLRDKIAAHLLKRGLSVVEDGADGQSEPLSKALILAKKSDVAVEIHFNAASPQATGIEVLSKPNKKTLGQNLAFAVHKATGLNLRGNAGWKADSSGQHHRLAFCEAGGLIIEICFISNKNDMAKYVQFKDQIALNLAEVLANA